MKKVKTIFFLTEKEAQAKREETGNQYITHTMPHYEMEDGAIMWAELGFPAYGSVVYANN